MSKRRQANIIVDCVENTCNEAIRTVDQYPTKWPFKGLLFYEKVKVSQKQNLAFQVQVSNGQF